MDILESAQFLRPGTAWNLRGGVLEQAEDGSPRVSVPTDTELQSVPKIIPPDLTQAKATLKDTTAKADDRLDAIVQILGI